MKIKTSEQILTNCKWINSHLIVFDLYSPLFQKSIPVELNFNQNKEHKEIAVNTIKSIIEFQNLSDKNLKDIYNAIFTYITKYKSQSDRELLGISTINEIIEKTILSGVGFLNNETRDYTYFDIYFQAEWDIEHGRTVSYFNGKLDDVN